MDVVKSNVEALKGSISVESKKSEGTRVIIRLPSSLTVLVVDGMLVRVGEHQYIIKMEDIEKMLHPEPDEIHTVGGRAECLNTSSEIYPLIRLHDLFVVNPDFNEPWQGMVILVHSGKRRAALFVDEIVGQQRIVVKDIDEQLSGLETIAGTAVLADTKVGLVLNIEGIMGEALGV